jgi:biotin synthase-like enzyme
MKKTLRLLITEKCHRKCEYCSNKFIKPKKTIDKTWLIHRLKEYDELVLTGGEPILVYDEELLPIIRLARTWAPKTKIFVYMSLLRPLFRARIIVTLVDGLTITIRNLEDTIFLRELNSILSNDLKFIKSLHVKHYFGGRNTEEFEDMKQITNFLTHWKKSFHSEFDKNTCRLLKHESFFKLKTRNLP